ncbi:MAG TPA: glycogen/starch synthase [Bacteroidales bacterium]|jgi:starch synthase|nr:glycogen/starch synthase [Bacteroidales bacterium]HPH53716.1 glycogen/starch synthase [Bacteroidales bacterium]
MRNSKKVLFVNSEIFPYMPESKISIVGRYLPQGTQESGKQIRSFMPRYGCINERRNQLHEVIRLSGMNIVVNKVDRPLVIKVSSISSARMQVYFIDNEDYFHRKQIWKDEDGKYFDDNDERGIFFARGVLETVKKLRWKPDVVHCQGWVSHFLPVYLKKVYKNDPIFADAKIVLSLYGEDLDIRFSDDIISKYLFGSLKSEDLDLLKEPTGINLAKLAIKHSDGIILGTDSLHPELESYIGSRKGMPILQPMTIGVEETEYIEEYNRFFDSFITPPPTNE